MPHQELFTFEVSAGQIRRVIVPNHEFSTFDIAAEQIRRVDRAPPRILYA